MRRKELTNIINKQKQEICISASLKQESQYFTELLFNTLFDRETDAEEALKELEVLFIKIRDSVCPEIKGKPCKTWEDFTEAIPNLFSSLKKV